MAQNQDSDCQDIALYTAPGGKVEVVVRVDAETVWLTWPKSPASSRRRQNITQHLRSIFGEGELAEGATCKQLLQVRQEGARQVHRNVKHYNLDGIISVGYRINSKRGTHFRIWATKTLRDHLIKGYSVNERRLKQRGVTDLSALQHFDGQQILLVEGHAAHGVEGLLEALRTAHDKHIPQSGDRHTGVNDPHPDGDRLRTVGVIAAATVFVVHTAPEFEEATGEDVGRIISARKATARERRAYEEERD